MRKEDQLAEVIRAANYLANEIGGMNLPILDIHKAYRIISLCFTHTFVELSQRMIDACEREGAPQIMIDELLNRTDAHFLDLHNEIAAFRDKLSDDEQRTEDK